MTGIIPSIFRRRKGREVRTWPLLALLLLVVLAAIACVLWFLREAARNERVAIRETLAEAYTGQLALLQQRMREGWITNLSHMDFPRSPSARFAQCVRHGLAQSVICLDSAESVTYPDYRSETSGQSDHSGSSPAATLQQKIRALAHSGDPHQLARFVLDQFPPSDTTSDAGGRLVSASAELLALQELGRPSDPDFQKIADRLSGLLNNYDTVTMPAAQRRFLMRSLHALDPARTFATLAAEDLAARFLEAHGAIPQSGQRLYATPLPDVWCSCSTYGQTVGLFTTDGLRRKLAGLIPNPALPPGVRLAVEPPGDETTDDSLLAAVPAGPQLAGWRLALYIDDNSLFDTQAARRVKFLVAVACVVIAAITALSILIARSFGRQVRLARLKNDLVATVSHELKTPLTAIRALVDTLIDSKRLDETTTREYLQLIAAENARLSRLIDNFLAFSRLERDKFAFDFKPLRPQAVVDAAVTAFGERAHAPGCTLEAGADQNLPSIRGDFDALTTALLNLLDNAWKYTGDEKRIRVGATLRNGSVSFDVVDNGIGLTPRESRRVFRQFYQSDQRLARNAGGCGLGLSIVQSIVENHHGAVRVRSEPGHGSTFTIEIPAIPA